MAASLVLTGPMGSGKSSLGQLLAARLDCSFIDLDAVIVNKAGKSINQIFAENGEEAFRNLESAALAELAEHADKQPGQGRVVIATGGGVVLRDENRRLLRQIGVVVNLTATLEELVGRLSGADDRPLLHGEEPPAHRLKRILSERERFYADADIRIDTTGKKLEDVLAEIIRFYQTLHK